MGLEGMRQVGRAAIVACIALLASTVVGAQQRKVVEGTGAWVASRVSKDAMTDALTVHYRLAARGVISNGFRRTRPSLHVRCADGEFDIYVVTEQVLSTRDTTSLRVRFDDDEADTWTWVEGTAHGNIFAEDPRELLSHLLEARVFRVEVPVYDANDQVIAFDVSGITAVAKRLSKACSPALDLRVASRLSEDREKASREAAVQMERESREAAEQAAEAAKRQEQFEAEQKAALEQKLAQERAAEEKRCAEATVTTGAIANCPPTPHVCAIAAQRGQYKPDCEGGAPRPRAKPAEAQPPSERELAEKAAAEKLCAEATVSTGAIANCSPTPHVCSIAAQRGQYKPDCPPAAKPR